MPLYFPQSSVEIAYREDERDTVGHPGYSGHIVYDSGNLQFLQSVRDRCVQYDRHGADPRAGHREADHPVGMAGATKAIPMATSR